MPKSRSRYRRASEIGEYVYCHRAWWLHHVLGHEPGNVEALRRGTQAHAAHGAMVRGAVWLRRAALVLALLAVLLMVGVAAGWL